MSAIRLRFGSSLEQLRHQTAVVLFTGDCRAEARQKQLSPRLLRVLHSHVAAIIRQVPLAELIVASSWQGLLQLNYTHGKVTVPASTLAEQVDIALRICFAEGYRSVLLVAGDVVQLNSAILRDAIEALEAGTGRFVLGRSGDGGFYLVGFGELLHLDWSEVPWYGASAAAGVSSMCRAAGLTEIALPQIDDIDDPEDARRVAKSVRRSDRLILLYQLLVTAVSDSRTNSFLETSRPARPASPSTLLRAPPTVRS